jgi:hypothetical protein
MESRKHIPLALTLFFCVLCIAVTAQEQKSEDPDKKHRFTLYAGLGPNYYLNNLVLARGYVNELNYSFVTRFMWEPEHFLSLGFETGYNRLYTVTTTDENTGSPVRIVNAAIPLHGVVTMKFSEHFYGSFNMGQAILINKTTTDTNGQINATGFSPADFGLTAGYKKILSRRIMLGAELKGIYSFKLEDRTIGLILMAGYRF